MPSQPDNGRVGSEDRTASQPPPRFWKTFLEKMAIALRLMGIEIHRNKLKWFDLRRADYRLVVPNDAARRTAARLLRLQKKARCRGHGICRQGNRTPPRASYRSSSASLNMPGFLAAELSGLTGEESSAARVCWKESGRESLVVSRRLAFPCKPFRSYDYVAYPRCGYWK
jgi:hypothetical protein